MDRGKYNKKDPFTFPKDFKGSEKLACAQG